MLGILKLPIKHTTDNRGEFKKIFQDNLIPENLDFKVSEIFISKSLRGTIRGMHLMIGSAANFRTINVTKGKVLDVLLDLREGSSTFGESVSIELNSSDDFGLLIPPGVAHGFQALEECEMVYSSSMPWVASLDTGINPFSFQFSWPISNYIISERDQSLPGFDTWTSYIKDKL